MASPPPNPREAEQGREHAEEATAQGAPSPQKRFVAPPAEELPSKLHYVTVSAPGPSGVKATFRTVKVPRRVPTLGGVRARAEASATPPEPPPPAAERAKPRRDRTKRHICATCDKRFSSPGKLNQHVLAHTGELPFSCDLCEKRFNTRFKLARHGLIHSEAKAFACNVCGKTFNRKDHLTNHVRVHNPVKKFYTCERPDCRKSYTSNLSYRKHVALHSAEEGNLQCKICNATFNTRQEIVYHLKVHTGSRTLKSETDKKFTCSYCDRRFFTAKDVRRHLVVHTGRRDFVCPFCPQKFGRKDHLVRHVKNAHPDESWKSAAVGTSSEPPPEASAFEETYSEFAIEGTEYSMWKAPSPKETTAEGRTRVPSSDIIVEIPPLDPSEIKVEPLELQDTLSIKQEEVPPQSCELLENVEYPPIIWNPSYLSPQDLIVPDNVESFGLLDPGEGPSGLSSQILELLEEQEPSYSGEEGRVQQQRLPAFTQAFQTAQSPKPPKPPPPPH